jgi:hypothetical protein
MQQLKTKDDERCAALQAQAASMAHDLEVKAALEAQLAMMAEDNRAKAEALKDLEASNDRQAAAAAEMGRKLQEAEGELSATQARCAALEEELGAAAAAAELHEGALARLQALLDERMRWIESLETSHAMHRKRIDALWNDLQTLLNTDTAGEPLAADGDAARLAEAQLEAVRDRLAQLQSERGELIQQLQQAAAAGAEKVDAAAVADAVQLRAQLASARAQCDALLKRASAAEAQLQDVQRELRGAKEAKGGGGGGGSPAGKGVQAQLQKKTEQLVELEEQNKMLKQMLTAQKGETRTRQMQNDQLRRKAGMTPSSSTGTAAPRRKGSSPDNPGMQRLP